MEWIILVLSIPVGVVAARLDVVLLWAISRVRYGKLSLSGHWAEWIPGSDGRQFSIGTIEYNVLRRRYNFDGTNYKNDGDPYCHWQTVTSYVDFEKLEFHYVFATKDVVSLQTTSYGHGVVQLVRRDGSLIPEDGYYIYATGANSAVCHSHTMLPIEMVAPNRNHNAAELLKTVFPSQSHVIE